MDFLIFQSPYLMIQALIDGIILGSIFALIAYGMALVWGVMNIINITQGELVILGGYVAFGLYKIGIHPLYGLIASPAVLFVVGWCLYYIVVNRVVEKDLFISILATFGLSIMIQQLMNIFFGADVQVAEASLGTSFLFDYNVTIPNIKIVAFVVSIISAGIIVLFMKLSKMGQAIRATAQNARAAKILGINTNHVYAITFGLNAAICGVAGAIVSMTFTLHPYIGLPYTIRSFMIVIVAGLGNLPAVIVSGVGLGVAEQYADFLFGTIFRLAFVFSLLVVILIWRSFRLSKKREYLK
ncbi:MAG: branched-chain amino acid ABC transporter permease [Pelagibacteraceae bacterium]|nr:branched-chain amino acid ABC transporter permease [Pelagibacteraceae bacterium]MBO6467800.1 branched-chain amino acid ABC transporter permease [Pelagibacteraceae bacterium]MBO6479315.1 branched-chain amino acid ABC transporter permease [Pelagibacteraceae bacterium]MDP6784931.1 branched-chain amino acid ABC transporter permease [Alphaproteobacteria bacterium]HJO13811.1 branched-chain amino acid ABC transporter permease [Alphaproteobacteria bacterium]|tara:strand:+ start:37 stop:930 length:894 start_codon:yes stop_codon:yes gene_type:complete